MGAVDYIVVVQKNCHIKNNLCANMTTTPKKEEAS